MNYRTLIIISCLFLCLFLANAQNKDVMDNISIAMNSGSSKELSSFFSEAVELKIDGEQENYSKRQAEVVMRNFFSKYPPFQFERIHKGSSPEGLVYVLGEYTHKNGKHRVNILIKEFDGNYLIDTLNLTKE